MTYYVTVAVDVPLAKNFDYVLEDEEDVRVGQRVVVPFGPRQLVGIVLAIQMSPPQSTAFTLKAVTRLLHDMPPLSAQTLSLLQFCADYYHHPLGQVLHTALPGRFRDSAPFAVPDLQAYLARDADALLASIPPRATLQRTLATMLAKPCTQAQLRAVSTSAWKVVRGWLATDAVRCVAAGQREIAPMDPAVGPPLNAEQLAAVNAITSARGFSPFLLFGITGSGKTEVYLRSIAHTLACGQQALVLVPEINLTPQLEARFRQRFSQVDVVALHSSVSDNERARGWVKAARGEARIVLGTRLAVFTPLPNCGLIVVDEEHDSSFKQQDGLRYSARDMAVYRAKADNIPIVLGSATPSLETWHNARCGRYQQLDLRQRAVGGATPPTFRLIPIRRMALQDGLHPSVITAIETRLARQEQVLVFLNRRGYAPVLHCSECGWMAACTRCSARLTVHLRA